jgi:toxin ParE1/3/4
MAKKIYAHIRSKIEKLSAFPESGRPGRVFGTRELIIDHYPYIVPYRVKEDAVEILRIFHTSRKPPGAW